MNPRATMSCVEPLPPTRGKTERAYIENECGKSALNMIRRTKKKVWSEIAVNN